MTCEATPVIQLDGSPYQGRNCGCAVAADLIRDQTCNRLSPTAAQVRTKIRTSSGAQFTGALSITQIHAVVTNTYKQDASLAFGISFANLEALMRTGKGAVISIDYGPLRGTAYDCFRGQFGGEHYGWVDKRNANGTWRWADPGADGRSPGVPKGYQAIPDALLRKAAGANHIYVREGKRWVTTTVDKHYGPGHAFAILGGVPDLPPDPQPEPIPGKAETMIYRKVQVMAMAANTPLYHDADLAAPVVLTVGPSFKVTTVGRPYRGNVVDTNWWGIDWTTNQPEGSSIATLKTLWVRSERLS
jgi:hypothetical protein